MAMFLEDPDWSSFSGKNDQSKWAQRGGYTYQPENTEQRDNTMDRTSFGGRATHYGPNGEVLASSGQQAAANYTSLGQAAAQRGAYQNNWAQSDQSRGQQQTAMGYMQNAAAGGAPSQAQMLGRNMIDQSLQAQMAGAASARGGSLAQAAAMRNAANMGDASRQQGMNQLSALRAQEMAQARGDYFGAASGMRGQDIGQQGMNMQSELAQRQLNQQGQQFNDQLAWNTLRSDQEAAMHQASIDSAEYQAQKQANQHSEDRKTNVMSSFIGALGGALSDFTAKTDVQPVGGPMANPYSAQAPVQSGPSMMGGGMMKGMMMSDVHAKREAFEEGAKYADAAHAGIQLKAPDYAKREAMRNPAAGPATSPEAERAHAERVQAARMAQVATQPPAAPAMAQVAPATQRPLPLAMAVKAIPAMPVMTSDDRAKVVEDYDVGEGPGDRDFDADEYLDSKVPGPRSFEDLHMHRDTKADQARVKRGYEDAAGRDADSIMAGYGAALAKGPATEEAMARANRSMAGSSYAYKPEFTPPEQVPGEKNVGPMAQNMAADPLAQTAVKQDPQSGLLMLDGQKMLKLNSAGIASLQRQIDSLGAAIAKRGRS